MLQIVSNGVIKMDERNIGKDVKALRTKKGIGSRELSRLVGKAETYISQLERGLIKTPDYNTAFNIMKHLGIREDKIEDHLFIGYYIQSPSRIEAEEAWTKQQIENEQYPEYQEAKLERDIERYEQDMKWHEREIEWLVSVEDNLNKKNDQIREELAFFIDKKLDTFSDVIQNLHALAMSMSKNEEDYNLFTNLFKRDLTKFNKESKKRIIETIQEEYKKSAGGWGEPPPF
jgi:transcriptional regulator with XRE-family HTH domain